MEQTDIRELRKVIKAKDSVIDWVYGVYVDAENNVCYEDLMRLSDMEEAEKFRHLNIFAKILSPRIGMETFPVRLNGQQEDLLGLRSSAGKSIDTFEAFRDQLTSSYEHTDPYYAVLVRVVYDVPTKAADRRTLEDGDLVYEALLMGICPAKLSKPALGFDVDHVAELGRRWQIGNPSCGFLYPSFADRGEDRNEVMIRSASPDTETYLNSLFGVEEHKAPVGVQTQRDLFSTMLAQLDVDLAEAAAISENILEKAAEPESMSLDRNDVKKIAEAAGVNTDSFDEIYEDVVGETPIAIAAVADSSVTVKTDTVTIRLPADHAQLIEARRIDGRDYILIPADGTVTVNGTAVRPTDSEAGSSTDSEEDS